MDAFGAAWWPFIIPITAIVGAFAYLIVATIMKTRVRELEIRQRIAMVERGLVPPPEADPRGFEKAMHALDAGARRDDSWLRANRHRRAGISLIGIGFGLMLLISIAGGSPDSGLGVGGFLVIVGLAFVANGWFERRQAPTMPGTISPGAIAPAPPADRPE
jgi:hypothetical protein